MGKLVLFMVDGKTLDIPLNREHVTIGRRTGNDVCLPYPAVSGKHAVVITMPTGSVIEDLSSTNGTYVNRRRVTKHYLHDGDKVEIGRQQLVYYADVNAAVPVMPGRARADARSEGQGFDAGAAEGAAASSSAEAAMQSGEASVSTNTTVRLPADVFLHDLMAETAAHDASGAIAGESWSGPVDSENTFSAPQGAAGPSLNVLSGPSAGRSVALQNEQTFIGRIGLQVAAVRRDPEGFRLLTSEGTEPPKVNGTAITAHGLLLKPGDVIEVAGAQIEFNSPDGSAPA